MARQISRDEFARETFSERITITDSRTCDFCGQVRSTAKHKSYLHRYYTKSDDGKLTVIPGLFCDIHCLRSHHNFAAKF